MNTKLSEKEFKKLVIEVAKNISPVLVEKDNDIIANANNIASYALQIATSVNTVLTEQKS